IDHLKTDFHTPTLSPIILSTDLTNRESDTDSIAKLVLSRASSYLSEEQEQICSSTPKTIINMEQENLFNNDNNQKANQLQNNIFIAEVNPWNFALGPQFQQVPLLKDTVLQLFRGSDYTQVYTVDYTNLFANNKFASDNESETTELSEEKPSIVELSKKELSESKSN
ncbi:11231_t:CDS:2, partial [Dentiscutata erythropus]